MNDQETKKKIKPDELVRAEHLIDEGKYDDALQIMKYFEEKGERTLHDIVSCHLLKCELLLQQDLYENTIQLAEQTYKESLGLGKNLLTVDALLLKANALVFSFTFDKTLDIIEHAEELLNTLTEELPIDYKQREAYLAFVKGWFYGYQNNADRALELFEHSLALGKEIGFKNQIGYSILSIAWMQSVFKGEMDQALKNAKRGSALAEERNNKYIIAFSFNVLGAVYSMRGEIDHSIRFYEQSLVLFKELNNKHRMAAVLSNLGGFYKMKGELDRALECLEQALAIRYERGNLRDIASAYDFLIQISIEKGDLERAKQFFQELEKIINQLKDKQFNLMYFFNKALILKESHRSRNQFKAEELFKQILEDEDLDIEIKVRTLLNLCELLLVELRKTNDLEVLDEIEPLIDQLSDIAEKSQSYWILCENHLIQAKLSLLTFNMKKAKRFLTQALQIAERFGLNQLAVKITNENEELLTKLELWEKLKDQNAPMSDRMELARLDEKILKMIQNTTELTAQVTEEKVAIYKEKKICLVCRGEVLRFSYICKCGAIYCGNCARALTDLENVCWACEVQIDYSKPVKSYKEESEIAKSKEKVRKI